MNEVVLIILTLIIVSLPNTINYDIQKETDGGSLSKDTLALQSVITKRKAKDRFEIE